MTDYTKASGSGTIMIRDTGSTVDFYFQSGYSSDFYNGLSFGVEVNGSITTHSVNYPTGAPNYLVASANVTASQTVTFKLNTATGIGGIGGPTTISAALNRNSPPSPPGVPRLSSITTTSVSVAFSDGANGGEAINSRQIAYGTNESLASTWISSDGSTVVTGLTPGTKYYFWARTHNALGYSGYSGPVSATTLKAPSAPAPLQLSSVTATTVDSSWTAPSNTGGAPITSYQLGYGTSSSTPSNIITTVETQTGTVDGIPVFSLLPVSSPHTFVDLEPGTVYYFFVRAISSAGTGPWSAPASVRTVAGAYVYIGVTPMSAIVFVNVAGTWTPCEVWTRNAGVWAPTT